MVKKKRIIGLIVAIWALMTGFVVKEMDMPKPRTGRVFQSSRYPHFSILRGAELLVAGIFSMKPSYIAASPVVFLGDLVLSPVYDIVCLPLDIYIRSCQGVTVRVHELDGTPIVGVKCSVLIPDTKDNGFFVGEGYVTGEDGTVYLPYCRNLASVHTIDKSLEELGYDVFPYSARTADGVLDVLALRRGVEYPALTNVIDIVLQKNGMCDISLLSERFRMPQCGVGMRIRHEYGEIHMEMLAKSEERTVRLKKAELADTDIAVRLSAVSYENRLDACRHLERGLGKDECIAFQSYMGGMYRGVITALTVNDDKTNNVHRIHLEWLASPQKNLPNFRIPISLLPPR